VEEWEDESLLMVSSVRPWPLVGWRGTRQLTGKQLQLQLRLRTISASDDCRFSD
jgi:hypothetical protein